MLKCLHKNKKVEFMNLFDILPENFFSILASPNRKIYINALFVIREAFAQEMSIPREGIAIDIASKMEDELLQMQEDDDQEEKIENSLSERAYYILRKLKWAGWIETEIENSKSYLKNTNRRIMIKAEEIKEYNTENYEQKMLFHEILEELKRKKIVDYDYLKYEEGNILDRIWLEKENIDNAYIEIQRENPKKNYIIILERLEGENFKQEWLKKFCEDIKKYMIRNQKENQRILHIYIGVTLT